MNPADDMLHIYLGYAQRLPALYNIAQHSIIRHCSRPVAMTPIKLGHLESVFTRDRVAVQSTEFSFSRFLTPFLNRFEGWALFMDNDIVARGDLAKLWDLRDDRYAVQCVKHDHQPEGSVKFLGAPQTQYPKKNWSSVMLMNCAKCTALTPDYVNTATGLELHQFKWLESEALNGGNPREWTTMRAIGGTISATPTTPAAAMSNR